MSDADHPNSLWLGIVKEWYDVARERSSKGKTTYQRAYNSLKACPLKFTHPSELTQLKGFGASLCARLTKEVEEHCRENGLPIPQVPRKKKRSRTTAGGVENEDEEDDEEAPKPVKKRKTKEYVPVYRSGPYALILVLASQGQDCQLSKGDLIDLAQPHCDASFTAPSDPTSFYTAWNSMKTLQTKDLVCQRGLKRYALTDEGWEVALRVKAIAEGHGVQSNTARPQAASQASAKPLPAPKVPAGKLVGTGAAGMVLGGSPAGGPARSRLINLLDDDEEGGSAEKKGKQVTTYSNVVPDRPAARDDGSLPVFNPVRLPPGSFQVHLVLDQREVRSKTDRDYLQDELAKKGVKAITRSLALGDALWVAKCTDPNLLSRLGAEGDEVVLDYIVERKRLDDLIYSIKDGRFHEQKFRLRRSGVRNVVYLVEDMNIDSEVLHRNEEMVESALASTQVVNGYFLKRTSKIDETIAYLTRMTARMKRLYENKTLHVIPTRVITAQNFLPLLTHMRAGGSGAIDGLGGRPVKDFYVSYPAFASLASKSEMITLRDVFLKMLMCTMGVTGEKAMEIQKRWKTPHDLIKAFEVYGSSGGGVGITKEQQQKRKGDMIIGQMGHLQGRKKMTKPVSQKLAEVWGAHEYGV